MRCKEEESEEGIACCKELEEKHNGKVFQLRGELHLCCHVQEHRSKPGQALLVRQFLMPTLAR